METTKEWVLLRNRDDFYRVIGIRPDLLKKRTVLCGTIELYFQLKNNFHNLKALVEYVPNDDSGEIFDFAWKKANKWDRDGFDAGWRGENFSGLFINEAFDFFLYKETVKRGCERLLATERIHRIWVLHSGNEEYIGYDLYQLKNNLIVNRLTRLAKTGELEIKPILPYPKYHPKAYFRLLVSLLKIMRASKSFFLHKKRRPNKMSLKELKGRDVTTSSNRFFSHKCTKNKALLFGNSASLTYISSFREYFQQEKVNGVFYGPQPSKQPSKDRLGKEIDFPLISLGNWENGNDSEIDAAIDKIGNLVDPDLKKFALSMLQRSSRTYCGIWNMLNEISPKVIYISNQSYIEKALMAAARNKKIPVFFFQHGFIDSTLYYKCQAHKLLVWGEKFRELMTREVGWKPRQLIVKGNTLLNAFKNLNPDQCVNHCQVLILTAGFDSIYPSLCLQEFERSWDEIVRLAKSTPDITIVIRHHPYFDLVDFYLHLEKTIPNIVISRGNTLEQDFKKSKVIVQQQVTSTAGLAAMATSIPVVFFCSAINKTPRMRGIWRKEREILNIDKTEDFIPCLKKLLKRISYGSFPKQPIQNQNNLFEQYCSKN